MNKEHIRFHLQEAEEAIHTLLDELDDDEYNQGGYIVDMTHLYYHLNTAWNGRDATEQEVKECSEENFEAWGRFPNDLLLLTE